ncbi:MAG: HAD hydrolase-like protein [Lachnospiraceae bacterium]|nr:HAD hydrolase-like protein [Lachnospiraceae bacterium]
MKNTKYDLAIFDADGTLFYTKPGIVACIKETVDHFGLRKLNEDEFDQFIGPPIHDTFAKVYEVSAERGLEIATEFRKRYRTDKFLYDATVYDGMMETLKVLKENGVKLGVATYKMDYMAEGICHHFHIDDYIDSIHGTDNESKRKKPDIIRMCMEDYNIEDPTRAVMIGDTHFDALGAEQAGCSFLGVTFGFEFKTFDDVKGFKRVIGVADTPLDILKFFIE